MARLSLISLVLMYLLIIPPFTAYLKERPVAVKLGYLPEAQVLKVALADYRNLFAQYAVVKVLFYYGSLVEKFEHKVKQQPEYFNMFKTLQTAVRLDPYNMDAYYFTQAAFTWELQRIKEVNNMLDYGMKYRTWDYELPFFAGFNAAYFQKDYKAAARYMQKAAELSGRPLFTNLAARYFYEAGQTDFGLLFLETMEKGAKDENVRRLYALRKEALAGVARIAKAVGEYRTKRGRTPAKLQDLVSAGFLKEIPSDPYGGSFYIDMDGNVRSTSKFAFAGDVKKATK
jgi:tetratricopeptide (TPR) repeat protein